ncbi:1-phosphofructokinase [Streptococcus devriesei]|uniref:1-phosphofructokinase n=1 Tax=Streptococcus devriesei TaxID=231233 RepID=UPI0004246E3C|nr:1-phosphofructokinase [Streptococcus devriesei]
MSRVYTCTMNLAIDLFIETEHMLASKVNRTLSDDVQANGKGVNVSFIMKQLGISTTAIGFAGGFTGKFITDTLVSKDIGAQFVEVDGLTRINVFTKVNADHKEFKLVNRGPLVGTEAQRKLLEQIKSFDEGDYLVVSGSLPRGVEPEILTEISKIAQKKGLYLIFDVSHPTVLESLAYRPYLLKPNEEELADWFGKETLSHDGIIDCAKELVKRGAQNILVSLGEAGAVAVNSALEVFECNAPQGEVVNTACAGDTLLATFLTGLIKQEAITAVLPRSVAAGSSTAFRSGLTDFSDVDLLQKQINCHQI